MDFKEYQEKAREVAAYPNIGSNIYYPTMGLAGEAGEVSNQVKKVMRDENDKVSPERLNKLFDEIGDCLWYVSTLCSELGFDMEAVAQRNIEKLFSRRDRGTLKGDGDNR